MKVTLKIVKTAKKAAAQASRVVPAAAEAVAAPS